MARLNPVTMRKKNHTVCVRMCCRIPKSREEVENLSFGIGIWLSPHVIINRAAIRKKTCPNLCLKKSEGMLALR